ncbi:MAG TPA: DUF3108 domain-containing protein [Blastocatellia bacterium]|nr:DUF3108 domain-containing protein [Blastocatellia bacterium]
MRVLCLVVFLAGLQFPPGAGWQPNSIKEQGQAPAKAPVKDGSVRQEANKGVQALPFKSGETLSYDIHFSKFIFSGSLGRLKVAAVVVPPSPGAAARSGTKVERTTASPMVSSPNPGDEPAISLTAQMVSKGFLTWLFGVKIEDSYESLVRADDFGLIKSIKTVDDGKTHRKSESVVDQAKGMVTYTETDLTQPSAPPRIKKADSPKWVLDLLSVLYYVRSVHLDPGGNLMLPLSDAAQVYNVEAIAGNYENVEVAAGKFRALPLNVKLFDGHYIKRPGQLIVWLSTDPRHLLVKARIKTSGATVTVSLIEIVQSK